MKGARGGLGLETGVGGGWGGLGDWVSGIYIS